MAEAGARDPSPGTRPPGETSAAARPARLILVLCLTAVAAAALWEVWTTYSSRAALQRATVVRLLTLDREFPAAGRYPSDPYVGHRVCAECHPGESALHSRSGHARTLRAAGRRALARGLDGTTLADPDRPDVRWSYRYLDGQLHIRRQSGGTVEDCIAEYAFGSGHNATTFVNVIDPAVPAILEHRVTYYTRPHALGLTPGQDARPRPPHISGIGAVFSERQARKCFGCHATQVSLDDRTIDRDRMIPNVSCERCHGPARAHVEAARRGAPDAELGLPFGPGRYTAEGLLTLCGTCHRHPSRARPEQIRPDDPHLARFQPVGVIASRCFRESRGGFSCVTCHDPHARASSDREAYRAVCVSCHPGGGREPLRSLSGEPAERSGSGTTCPVAPRGDCVECHMPRVECGQHVLFADHWIRIRRANEPVQPLRGPAMNLRLLDTPEP